MHEPNLLIKYNSFHNYTNMLPYMNWIEYTWVAHKGDASLSLATEPVWVFSLIDLSILTGWKLTSRSFYSLVLKDFQFPAKECDDPGPLSLSWLMPRSSRSFPWYLLFCTNILGFVILLHSCLVVAWISLFTSIICGN